MCNNGFGGGNCCWMGRQRLRLWLRQQLRLQSQSLLLNFHKRTDAPGR